MASRMPSPTDPPVASAGDVPAHLREDTWTSAVSGIGVAGYDKTVGARLSLELLSQMEAEQLWRGDDLCGRVVETIPRDATRSGYDVVVPDDLETAEEAEHAAEDLGVLEHGAEAWRYARAFGGGAVLLGVEDGLDPAEPLDYRRIRKVTHLTALTPRELRVAEYYTSPLAPHYGWPAAYDLTPYAVPISYDNQLTSEEAARVFGVHRVHASRVWRFDGIRTTRLARLQNVQPGWSDSVLMRIVRVISSFQLSYQGLGILLQDMAPAVLKMKGLADALATGKATRATVSSRAQALELVRSVARVVVVDGDEDYSRQAVSLAGLGDALDKLQERLAAAAEMPVSLLMGRAPGGLGATGNAEMRWWEERVAAEQRNTLAPYLKWVHRALFTASGGEPKTWTVQPRPLRTESDAERAATRLAVAQADAIYLANQVLHPAEVARSRFGGDEWSMETVIDADLRDEMLDDRALVAADLSAKTEAASADAPEKGEPPAPPEGEAKEEPTVASEK